MSGTTDKISSLQVICSYFMQALIWTIIGWFRAHNLVQGSSYFWDIPIRVKTRHRILLSIPLGGSKVDVELVANLQCKSKACFLAYFRQFKIRRMFTLQLQRQKSKKLRPWERSHWKADEKSLYLNYNMSQNYGKVQSLKKNLVKFVIKNLTTF